MAKNHYLVYYKSEDTAHTCLATVDLALIERIQMVSDTDFCVGPFQLKAQTGREALDWVEDLRIRRKRTLEYRKTLLEVDVRDNILLGASNKTDNFEAAVQHMNRETSLNSRKFKKLLAHASEEHSNVSDDEDEGNCLGVFNY